MISLALCVVVVEAGFCLVLIFQRPSILHSFLSWAIQLLNQEGPFSAVHKGFLGSMALVLAPTLFRIFRVRRRISDPGLATLTDHLMLQTHLLEASLIGIALFLFMIICQLHSQLCEIAFLRKKLEALKKQAADSNEDHSGIHVKLNQQCGLGREEELACHKKIDALESMVLDLKKKIEDLQVDSQRKDEEIRAAEANAKALQKQSEGFLLEYDRLLEDNQSLRSQLSSVDRRLHQSDSMKKKS